MCIIGFKDTDLPPIPKSVLQNCWNNNGDGAGFAIYQPEEENWKIVKGFMKWKKFWKALQSYNVDENTQYFVHFRWATHGNKDGGNTHPFPLFTSLEEQRQLNIVTKHMAIHNGVAGSGSGIYSDTMVCIDEYINPLFRAMLMDEQSEIGLKPILEENINTVPFSKHSVTTSSRWVLTNGPEIYYFGLGWQKDKETGYVWSNDMYKTVLSRNPEYKSPVTSYGGGAYGYNYNHYNDNGAGGNNWREDPTSLFLTSFTGLVKYNYTNDTWYKWDSTKRMYVVNYDEQYYLKDVNLNPIKVDNTTDKKPPKEKGKPVTQQSKKFPTLDVQYYDSNGDFMWDKWAREQNQKYIDKFYGVVTEKGNVVPFKTKKTREHDLMYVDDVGDLIWDDKDKRDFWAAICPECFNGDAIMDSPFVQGDLMCASCGVIFDADTGTVTSIHPDYVKKIAN
jgi:ribosomal protein S27E